MSEENQRKAAFTRIKKIAEQVANHARRALDLEEAETTLELLNEDYNKALEAHSKLVDLSTDETAIGVQEAAFEPIRRSFVKARSDLKRIIKSLTPTPSGSLAGSGGSSSKSIKLPKVDPPTFSGDRLDWPSYKDLFTATIHNNASLSDVEKLQYLKLGLKDAPAKLIKDFTLTDANYTVAWRTLEKQYDDKRKIVYALIKKLFDIKPAQTENLAAIANLRDSTLQCLRSLEAQGYNVAPDDQLLNCILVVLTVRKIDEETRKKWEEKLTQNQLPTLNELLDFLETRVNVLQSCSDDRNQRKQPTHQQNRAVHAMEASAQQCRICDQQHPHFKCPQLGSLAVQERNNLVKTHNLCINCLKDSHQVRNCTSNATCRECNKKHHTLLHYPRNAPNAPSQNWRIRNAQQQAPSSNAPSPNAPLPTAPSLRQPQQQGANAGAHIGYNVASSSEVLLQTAVVNVLDAFGCVRPLRLFLDSGAQASLITEECVTRLGLSRQFSNLTITGIGSRSGTRTKGKVAVTLKSRWNVQDQYQVECHILDKVAGDLPQRPIIVNPDWTYLLNLPLADEDFYTPGKIDMIVGADYYDRIVQETRVMGNHNEPVARQTLFGYVLTGKVGCSAPSSPYSFHVTTSSAETNDILKKFWEVEEPPRATLLTKEEKYAEELFQSTTIRDKDGRLIVKVPFNEKKSHLGESRPMALRRLHQLERKLSKSPEIYEKYREFMQDYIETGHMVEYEFPPEQPGFYFPHHAVFNTKKIRVVFDGSAKTSSGLSFNDIVCVGAMTQPNLYDHLLSFRRYPIAVKGDIKQMYRQIMLYPEDALYHRILWRESPNQPVKEYMLLTVTYGTAYAPSLATRCLKKLADDVKETLPLAAQLLSQNMNVDDLLTSFPDNDTAIRAYQEITKATATAGMEMKKWASSSEDVLRQIPESDLEMKPVEFEGNAMLKALGVRWSPLTDELTFTGLGAPTPGDAPSPPTKRTILSELGRIFDPLGLISPVTVRAKLILQELWRLGCDWDDMPPEHIIESWKHYQMDLQNLAEYKIPRCLSTSTYRSQELHGFADASEKGYGAVIYLRTIYHDSTVTVSFVTSKTKVAPLKQVTLPRLELNAAVLLAELMHHAKELFNLECPAWYWSDSSITLYWIKSDQKKWKTYIANRVAVIRELSSPEQWIHIPGVNNPADLASRGAAINDLQNSFVWKCGPKWLHDPDYDAVAVEPFTPINVPPEISEEKKETAVVHHTVAKDPEYLTLNLIERFSSLRTLIRVTAYLLRWRNKSKGLLSAKELHEARDRLLRHVQLSTFEDDIQNLLLNHQVKSNSKLKSLHPFVDSSGVLRVGGRLLNADVPESLKHQAILPAKSHLTTLLIRHSHQTHMHAGVLLTMASLQEEFWIIGGKSRVRKIIWDCVTCRRYKAKVAEQLMGDLPPARVTPCRPFLHTGVDFAGPFMLLNPVGRAPKTYKGYMCVFVCMATKAVHLEAVSSLSTPAFLETLSRFVCRRGLSTDLYSDCGTNFREADKELRALFSNTDEGAAIANKLSGSGVTWHFNPLSAPHHGGLWEAAVKSAKFHLKRVVGKAPSTYEHFATLLCRVEAVLNSRPLYERSSDPTDFEPLTPGHFLIGAPLTSVPMPDVSLTPTNRLDLFQRQQQMFQHFWTRWRKEYLATLQKRNKWNLDQPDLALNTMVLLLDEAKEPGQWKMGRIIAVHPGEDGHIRVVTVRTQDSTFRRPITKLIPLIANKLNYG